LGAEAFFGDSLECGESAGEISPSLADYLMACERDYLQVALDKHGWHMTQTAEALGISRKTLWEKLRRMGIHAEEG
jgi:DNA-binding NtrC family response regulator